MSAQQPSSPSPAEVEERKRVWERIKATAQQYHDHHQDHGINTKIARDAGRSSQTVGDWKHARTPVPPSVLATLAAKYQVSASYLACLTNDPEQTTPPDEADLRARMLDLVEQAIAKSDTDVSGMTGALMSSKALEMLHDGESNATILGTLIYMAEGQVFD